MKYKYTELLVMRENLYKAKSSFENQLLSAYKSTYHLIQTESFVSTTKDAINAELSNYNVPLLQSYRDLVNGLYNELDRLILRFQEVVKETSSSAIIDTSEFAGLKKSVEQPTQDILNLIAHPDLSIAYSAIVGMVSVSNPSSADIASKKGEAVNSLNTTEKAMQSFNGELLGKGVTDTLSTIETGLSKVRKAVSMKDPYHNVKALAIFNDTELKKKQDQNHKTLRQELINNLQHYNPEITFDLSKMSEDELQTLGRSISLVSYSNGGKKPKELIRFLEGHQVTFEKEITVYDTGVQYFKSKISFKAQTKKDSVITFKGKYKNGKTSVTGDMAFGGLTTDIFQGKYDYEYSNKVAFGDFYLSSGFNTSGKLDSDFNDLNPSLSMTFGYKNHSFEVGNKAEDGYRVSYVKETATVKQDFATLTATDEIGQRNVDHMGNALEWVAENPIKTAFAVGAVVVGIVAAPAVGAALGTLGVVKAIGAVVSIFIGVSIFNDKGK